MNQEEATDLMKLIKKKIKKTRNMTIYPNRFGNRWIVMIDE